MLWNYLNFFVALLELHWISARAPLDLLSHKVWLLDETSLSSRILWECWQFLDIYAYFGYPWISMDIHGFP